MAHAREACAHLRMDFVNASGCHVQSEFWALSQDPASGRGCAPWPPLSGPACCLQLTSPCLKWSGGRQGGREGHLTCSCRCFDGITLSQWGINLATLRVEAHLCRHTRRSQMRPASSPGARIAEPPLLFSHALGSLIGPSIGQRGLLRLQMLRCTQVRENGVACSSGGEAAAPHQHAGAGAGWLSLGG